MRSKLLSKTERRLRRDWFQLLLLAMVVAGCFCPPLAHAQDDQNRQKTHRAVPVDWGASFIPPGHCVAGTVNDRLDALHLGDSPSDGLGLSPATSGRHLNPGTVNSSWNGGTGNWSTSSDWNPNGVPNNGGGNTYNVTIDSGGTDLVSLDLNATINSLVLGGATGSSTLQNLSGSAETLNITGPLTVNQTGQLTFGNGSTLTVGGNATNAGSIDLEQASTLTVSGNFTNSGVVSTSNLGLGGSNALTVADTFTNQSGAQLNIGVNGGTNDVANLGSLANTGSVTIGQGATLNLTNQPNGITDVPAGSMLNLAGTLNAGAHNGLAKLNSIEGSLTLENAQPTTATPGSGTLTVSSSGFLDVGGEFMEYTTLTVSGNLTNSGLVSLQTADSLTVTGTFTNKSSALLGFYQSSSVQVGAFVNNGYMDFYTGSTLKVSGNLTNSGRIILAAHGMNDTIDVTGMFTNQAGAEVNWGPANFLTVTGTFINQAGAQLNLGPYDVANMGTLSNSGGVELEGSTTLTLLGNLTNSGTVITFGSGNTLAVDGTFTNRAGAQLDLGDGDVTKIGTLNNSGTILAEGGTLATIQTNKGAINTGTLEAYLGGSLVLDGNAFKNTGGTIQANGAGSLVLLENGAVITGGTLSTASGGLIETPSGQTATLSGLTNSGAYVMADNSTTFLSGKITNNGTISLDSTGDNTILMVPTGGATLQGSGTLTLGTGGPNMIEGSNGKETLTNASTIQGAGTIGNLGLTNTGTILANAGTLTIAPSTSGYAFRNNGTLTVDSGSTVNITGPVKLSFQTAGTVTVNSGGALSVGGSATYAQTKGSTTVDGNLSASNGISISGGTVFGNLGTLAGNFNLSGTGAISPGDGIMKVGELTINGMYAQGSTASALIDLGGTSSGKFDVVNITNAASLNGKLIVDLVNGFTPVAGNSFDIMNYSSETGMFSSETLPTITGDHWLVTIGATDVLLQLLAGTGPTRERGGSFAQAVGDAGFAGYLPPSALPPTSQFDSSSFSNFGAQPTQTPEPSSLLLLGSVLLGIGMWSRRQLRS